MTDEQYDLLDKIREALAAQPEEPDWRDYEDRGIISRDEYYDTYEKFKVVEDIRSFIETGFMN